jgi:dihydroneopterin aldolase
LDRITLRRIVAHGRHGANPGERDLPQPFHIDISYDLDLSRAGDTDSIADTVDYATVYERIMAIVEQESYCLLERLGSHMLDAIMADGRIARGEVTIAKPGLLDGATPSVTMVRERQPWP